MMPTRPGYIWSGTEWVDIGSPVSPIKYQATAPTTPSTGDLWIESDVDVPSVDSALLLRWRKTMAGGETSLSGNDDNALPLTYTPGYEQLYINGVLQVRTLDYTATTGNTITGLTALVANDVVEIFSALAYNVANVYNQTQSDARYFISSTQPTNRNAFINGSFAIDQRGTVSTGPTALAYSACDRWYQFCTGSASAISSQKVAGTAPNQYNLRITGYAGNTGVGFGQRIEDLNCFHFAGQTATLSISLASSVITSITWTAYYANTANTFGTIASPTRTQIATGTFTISSTLTAYSASMFIPSAATTGIEIVFTGGALPASQTLTISNAQFELGSVATSFERRPIGLELALCQRYLPMLVGKVDFMGLAYATNGGVFAVPFPVTARTIPTSVTTSNMVIYNNVNTLVTPSSITLNVSGTTSGSLIAGGTLTQGTVCRLEGSSDTSYVMFNGCEL